MKAKIQKLAEKIQSAYLKTIIIYCAVWMVSVIFFIFATSGSLSIETIIILIIAAFLILEGGLRSIFYAAYGPKYLYSVLTYFLIDHPLYGNALRKNARSKDINFLIFDNFIFPPGTGRILDLQENIKNRKKFNINSLGFRGREFMPDKKSSTLRIFCLGGSTTCCDCNDDDEAWPAQLELNLKNANYDVEVINAGVAGWYSYQDYLRLKEEIINYQPDIILLHHGWNEEFEFSSLSLGKKWKPKTVRNVREENNLYCPPNKLLSNTKILSLYLAIQSLLKQYVFVPNMHFSNPERWKTLINNNYIKAWFHNLTDMAVEAKKQGFLAYTIDYPGLANMEDTQENRKVYIENSRLTNLYADYQAVSKKRISHTLKSCTDIIPCLNTEEDFLQYRGVDRLTLFHDEIHLTPSGNALLAQAICKKLTTDSFFNERYQTNKTNNRQLKQRSNTNIDNEIIEKINKALSNNPFYLNQFINNKIDELKNNNIDRSQEKYEIPTDRYTTF